MLYEVITLWRYPLEALNLSISGRAVEILGVPMRRGGLMASGISVVVFIGLFLFFRGTMLGRAVRSIIQDEEGNNWDKMEKPDPKPHVK